MSLYENADQTTAAILARMPPRIREYVSAVSLEVIHARMGRVARR